MQDFHVLPEEFHDRHKLLLYYQDYLLNLLKIADEKNLSDIKVQLSEPLEENVDLLDYLMENKREEGHHVVSSHLFFSLLRDFAMYMGESFNCIERGKVSVAYSISRKPIKDSVFYFCMLLNNQEDMIYKVYYGEPKEIDVTQKSISEKKQTIKEASEIIGSPEFADIVYDFIYSKGTQTGLNRIWDQSLHLITGNNHYPTKKQNFNFIFADDEIWFDYWRYFYIAIPSIMRFSIEVIVKLFEKITNPTQEIKEVNKLLRDFKFLIHSKEENDKEITLLKSMLSHLTAVCDECGEEIKIDERIYEVVNSNSYKCPRCNKVKLIGDYITSTD